MEQRLIDLEMRFLHLERTVAALDEVVIEQRQLLDRLESKLDQATAAVRLLTSQISELGAEDNSSDL